MENAILKCEKWFQTDILEWYILESELDFNHIHKMIPDWFNGEPAFRVEYFDAESGFDKVFYIKVNFTVERATYV